MKNRMRESRSFGSVRGEGSNVLAYSENRSCSVVPRPAERLRVIQQHAVLNSETFRYLNTLSKYKKV